MTFEQQRAQGLDMATPEANILRRLTQFEQQPDLWTQDFLANVGADVRWLLQVRFDDRARVRKLTGNVTLLEQQDTRGLRDAAIADAKKSAVQLDASEAREDQQRRELVAKDAEVRRLGVLVMDERQAHYKAVRERDEYKDALVVERAKPESIQTKADPAVEQLRRELAAANADVASGRIAFKREGEAKLQAQKLVSEYSEALGAERAAKAPPPPAEADPEIDRLRREASANTAVTARLTAERDQNMALLQASEATQDEFSKALGVARKEVEKLTAQAAGDPHADERDDARRAISSQTTELDKVKAGLTVTHGEIERLRHANKELTDALHGERRAVAKRIEHIEGGQEAEIEKLREDYRVAMATLLLERSQHQETLAVLRQTLDGKLR